MSTSPPPALSTSHLNAQQPGSGSLAVCPSWPFPFVALRAVCYESSHWATRCLQKSPLWQQLFIPAKAAEKAGHRAQGDPFPPYTSPGQLIKLPALYQPWTTGWVDTTSPLAQVRAGSSSLFNVHLNAFSPSEFCNKRAVTVNRWDGSDSCFTCCCCCCWRWDRRQDR